MVTMTMTESWWLWVKAGKNQTHPAGANQTHPAGANQTHPFVVLAAGRGHDGVVFEDGDDEWLWLGGDGRGGDRGGGVVMMAAAMAGVEWLESG
ncbi:hypothetical protein Tco_0470512, partial [Tanacetum coccineum]